jgi:hypothetical protein
VYYFSFHQEGISEPLCLHLCQHLLLLFIIIIIIIIIIINLGQSKDVQDASLDTIVVLSLSGWL